MKPVVGLLVPSSEALSVWVMTLGVATEPEARPPDALS
jgi:hypothetical protein